MIACAWRTVGALSWRRIGTLMVAVWAGTCTSGCYLSHGLPDDETDEDAARPGMRDAGGPALDAGVRAPPSTPEGGLPPTFDGGPLPDDEPDVLPGERPSDDPASDDWRDPPVPADEVCCEIGPIVGLDDPDRQAGVPVVAWSGSEWGAAWRDLPGPSSTETASRLLFRRLDRDARPLAEPRVLEGFAVPAADLAWGNGRYALLTGGPLYAEGPGYLTILDTAGTPRFVAAVPENDEGGVVERFPAAHGWAVVTYLDVDGGAHGQSRLLLFDDELRRSPVERDLGTSVHADWRSVAIATLKSRLAVVQGTPEGIRVRVFDGRELVHDEAAGALVWPGTRRDDRGAERVVSGVGAAPLRDTVVAAYMNSHEVNVLVVDPFGAGLLHGPTPVAASPEYRNPGVAGDDVSGTAGICYPHGASPPGGPTGTPATVDADAIRFVAVGPDGRAIGSPVTIVEDLRYVAACDVGVAGPGEFVVIWWNAARGLERRHSIQAATVRLRR